jgi:hypothetical protein
MRWNEVKFIKFIKCSETRLWETTTRFIEFYQKVVLGKLSVFQTYRSFSASQRPSHRPHRRQESRDLHECAHTYQLLWIPTKGCLGKSPSCTPWTRDSYGASVWLSQNRRSTSIRPLLLVSWSVADMVITATSLRVGVGPLLVHSCDSSMMNKVGLRNILMVSSLYNGPNTRFILLSYYGNTVVNRMTSKTASWTIKSWNYYLDMSMDSALSPVYCRRYILKADIILISDKNKPCCASTRVSFKSSWTLMSAHFAVAQCSWRRRKRVL